MIDTNQTQKCYNSFSCIGSILIILFVLGSIIWDICVTKPAMRESIDDIRIEVKDIHKKLNTKFASDTISFYDAYVKVQQDRAFAKNDSISK